MRLLQFAISLLLLSASVEAATVDLVQTSVNDADGSTLGAVASDQWLESGSSYTTLSAPSTYSSYRFTHWTNTSYPSEPYRDAWGRSCNPITFTLYENTTAIAHYLPATRDSDGDGVPDWFEKEYYGDLSRSASSDSDGDGITLLAEYTAGTNPLYANSSQEGGVACADSALVTCNLAAYPTYTLRSVPTGTVSQSAIVPPGTVITTPDLSSNSSFGYWTLDGVRQQDAWGAAWPQFVFTVGTTNREGVAYLFTGDTDRDGVADAYEQYYYGTLANGATSDTDGDGVTLLSEYLGGTSPIYGNSHQDGGVSCSDSGLVTVNLADFSQYTLTSVPAGTVSQSAIVPDGTVIVTPNMTQPTFGCWTLDGVRQQDSWGVALRQFSFTIEGADRTGIAYLFANDSDGDGINDGYEQFYYGTLINGANSDTDGDGVSLLAEYTGGTSPIYGDSHQEGGVTWVDSPMVVANLQPYDRLSQVLVRGALTNFFSSDPSIVTGIDFGTWSSAALTDWDGDGDLDLFVASEEGLRVFRNIGTAHNPNFEEITTGFIGLNALVASIDRPVISGGDWNGDGRGDLVIGGNTGTLRLVASGGAFNSDGMGTDFVSGAASARAAFGDMNGDGKADLLVLLPDGTVQLYLNNGTATAFSGSGQSNLLGIAVPAGTSISTGDINQDGIVDVLLSDDEGRIWDFIHNVDGTFALKSKVWGGSFAGFASGLTLATGDLEGDGDLDLVGGLANGGLVALRDPSAGRPTGLTARSGANSIMLGWNPSWQSRIRGYYIYRALSADGPWERLLPNYVSLPSYLDTSAASSIEYFYCVSSVSYFFLPGNSQPHAVESLPSDAASASAGKVILSVRPVRGNPGQKVKIKLSIENAVGVSGSGMQIKVAYDSSKLQPLAQALPGQPTVLSTGLSKNLIFGDNGATANGDLVINGSGGSVEPGSGKLFTLQFKVGAGVTHASILGVSITAATIRDLSGNLLAVEILAMDNQPESGDAYIDGDLNGDGQVTADDKDFLKELLKPKSRPPTAEELMAGDLNGDGKLDEKDLVLLIRLLNGLPLDNIP